MKKLIVLFIVMCSFIPLSWAMDGCNQHLSPDEFRAKQKAYITEKAGLTKEEAAKFFPVYFELQDRKKQLNDEAWNLLRKGRDEKTTEAQYNEILEGVYDARIATNRLEKTYYEKFKKILSNKKIYLVQRAEMRFNRELLKGMHHKGGEPKNKIGIKGKKLTRGQGPCGMIMQAPCPLVLLLIYPFPPCQLLSLSTSLSSFLASFQMASISSRVISCRFLPSLMVCASR